MNKRLTIYDIAEKFNLSIGTISKIMNNKGTVSPETRKKVLDYVKKVGYFPISNARNLKLKRSYSIGVVFSEELDIGLEHPFFASILQHFKKYVEKRGYEISFVVSQIGDRKYSYLDWCKSRNIDGIYIVAGNYEDQGILELVNSDIPCVTTEMGFPNVYSVISDNAQGIKLTIDYIHEKLKKHKIALISGPMSSSSFKERTNNFLNYSKELQREVEENYIEVLENYEFTSGYKALNNLLSKVAELPEVIVVSSDDIAFGVLRALFEKKINVPTQIQIIGFDDIPYAERTTPALTTIRQNRKVLGETAAQILLDLINDGKTAFDLLTRIDTKLIIRETTKEE
jgi:LacI family transcriptional regulator